MLRIPTLIAALALIASAAGAALPAGDALAVIRPQLALTVAIGGAALALSGRWRSGLAALALAGVMAVPIVAAVWPPGGAVAVGPTAFRLYQKNLLSVAWPRYSLAGDILDSGAAVVTLQEVSAHNRRFMPTLWRAYPTQKICATGHRDSIAILSSWPAMPGSGACGPGYAMIRLDRPGAGPVWVVAVHLDWPWPVARQAAQAQALAARIAALDGPVMVAGDFNMQPWGASVQAIATAAAAHPARPDHVTYPGKAPWLPLSIDHVFLPEGWNARAEVRPLLGSDHLGLLVQVAPPG